MSVGQPSSREPAPGSGNTAAITLERIVARKRVEVEKAKINTPLKTLQVRCAQLEPARNFFAAVVKEYYPNAVVTVEGFTDPSGSTAYNLRLGRERAEAVKAVLLSQGLMDTAVKVVSYGEARDRQVVPGAQGPGAEGMQNRRVSLVIDYSGDPLAVRPITN